MRKKKEVGEIFHTFLKPICVDFKGITYYVYGYRAIDGKVVSFSATNNINTPWTKAKSYDDIDLISTFIKILNK